MTEPLGYEEGEGKGRVGRDKEDRGREGILGVVFDQEGKEGIREGQGKEDSQVGPGKEGPLRVFGNFESGQVERVEKVGSVGRVGWCWNG